jgi:MSHA biogenesis protein MshP
MKTIHAGFSLVTAIFLLVVVATLGAYMVTIGSTQQQTSTLSILGARTLAAADSGVEWGVAQVIAGNACFASPASFTLAGGAASGFGVTATCAMTSHTEGATAFNVFRINVTAARGTVGSADYTRRTIRTTVTMAP